jgi:hypothetical protein
LSTAPEVVVRTACRMASQASRARVPVVIGPVWRHSAMRATDKSDDVDRLLAGPVLEPAGKPKVNVTRRAPTGPQRVGFQPADLADLVSRLEQGSSPSPGPA